MFNVGDFVDSIAKYHDIFEEFGYTEVPGGGKLPWSHRVVNPTDNSSVEFRATEWIYENALGQRDQGRTAEELHRFFLARLSREQLIDKLAAK